MAGAYHDHRPTARHATQLLVGLSWASLWPSATPVDVRVGMITTFGVEAPRTVIARQAGTPRVPTIDASGGFLELALRVDRGRHWRTWAGVRGELMDSEDTTVRGGAGRVSFELWAPVRAASGGALLFGSIAVSGWAELGVRERADRSVATVAAAGLGMRLPFALVGR